MAVFVLSAVFVLPLRAVTNEWLVENETCVPPACQGACECTSPMLSGSRLFSSVKRNLPVLNFTGNGNWQVHLNGLNIYINSKNCNVSAKIINLDTREDMPSDIMPIGNYFNCKFIPLKPVCCCAETAKGKNSTERVCQEVTGLANNSQVCPGVYQKDGVSIPFVSMPMPESGDCSALEQEITGGVPQGQAAGISEAFLKAEAKKLNKLNFTSVEGIIGRIINTLMAFVGSIALVLYIYAGILWMTAAGTAERIQTSKRVIIWTTFGLVVMFGSYLIVTEVFSWLGL